jgi:HAE1 family hydrophobic/amphiphilic exporter-1
MTLSEFSVKRRVTVTMIVAIVVVIGVISVSRIGLDLLPEMEFPTLFVMTTYQGVAPEDMEELVTRPVEEAVAVITGVKQMKSFSQEGVSVISLEFEWGTNLDVAAQDIRNALSLLRDFMPEDVSEPMVMKFSSEMMPVRFMAVTSESMNAYQLKKLLKKVVKPRLERLDGVAAITLMGGHEREIHVKVDKKALEGKGLALSDLIMMLRAQNVNLPGGYIEEPHQEFLVRSVGEYKDLKDIELTVVGMGTDGSVVRLKDVAEVVNAPAERRDFSQIEGREGIMLIINKQSGANALKVSRNVTKGLEEVKEILPAGITFYDFFDQGDMVSRVTSKTGTTGLYGALLAVVMILIFLRDPRPTLAIGIAIPLSVMAAFIPIYFIGYTLNLMTLGGFALGVGMLVDNAIVVIENIFRHLERGEDRKTAAIVGAREVQNAIVASTLTTVVVFVPMMFAEGIPGQIAKALASTVSFSLLGSLFVALTIVPMLASVFFRELRPGGQAGARPSGVGRFVGRWREGRFMGWVKVAYDPVLRWSLRHRAVVVVAFLALFAASGWLMTLLGTEFLPRGDQPFLSMEIVLPVGSTLSETEKTAGMVEDVARNLPGIEVYSVWGGLNESTRYDVAFGTAQAGVNYAQVGIKLKEKTDRDLSSDQLTDLFRKRLPRLEGVKFNFPDMNSQMMGLGSEKAVSIRLFGSDMDELKQLSERIKTEIEGIKGIRDVDTSLSAGLPEINIKIDREKAGALGLTVGQISAEMQSAMQGTIASQMRQSGEEFNIRVRFKEEQRKNVEDIRSIPIRTPMKGFVQLGDIATVKRTIGPVKINRQSQMRVAMIEANTGAERDLGSIIADVGARLDKIAREFPEGYFTEFGGEYARMVEYFTFLGYAFILALILIYMVMAAQFESFSQPFIIMFTVPLCMIGVFGLLAATGNRFNLASGLGVIVLVGIAVNNGIVMIDYVNQLRGEGVHFEEAVIEGAKTRLRPILITVGTTVIGMLPMAIDKSEGAETRNPLALAVIGGLLTSTLLTLIIVPVIYHTFSSAAEWVKAKRAKS